MMVRKVQLEFCSESKLFAPSDDILTLQRYELIPKLPNFQGIFIHHYPCMLIEWASINMPQTLYTSWFEACHVNRLIDFRKNGCTPMGWNVWGMCVESQNRFPTLQTLYTSAFSGRFVGNGEPKGLLTTNRLGVSPLIQTDY